MGKNISSWKSLNAFCTRVSAAVYNEIQEFMTSHGMQGPPFPQKWITPSFMLPGRQSLRGGKSDTSLTEGEQILAFKRLLFLVKERAESENIPFDDANFALAVSRKVKEQERSTILGLVKKYVAGIEAASLAHGRSYAELEPKFLSGIFDSCISNTMTPEVTGKYWNFIKEFNAEQLLQVHVAAAQKAEEDAREAEEAVEKLKGVAKDVQQSGDAKKMEAEAEARASLLEKVRLTYLLQLKSWHAKNKAVAEKSVAEAEELWVLRQDELAKEQTETVQGEYFLVKGDKSGALFADSSLRVNCQCRILRGEGDSTREEQQFLGK